LDLIEKMKLLRYLLLSRTINLYNIKGCHYRIFLKCSWVENITDIAKNKISQIIPPLNDHIESRDKRIKHLYPRLVSSIITFLKDLSIIDSSSLLI